MSSDEEVSSDEVNSEEDVSEEDDLMNSQTIKFGLNKQDILKRKALYDFHSNQAKGLKYNSGKYDDELEALFYVSTPCKPWLDEEEAQARGIDLESDILVGIKFSAPRLYMFSKPIITIRQTKMKDLDEIRESDMHAFGLTWPLEDRAKKFLEHNFERMQQQCVKDETELWKINEGTEDFLEMLGSNASEFEKVMYSMILKDCKGDTMAALEVVNSKKKENYKKQAEQRYNELVESTKKSNILIHILDYIKKSVQDITSECLICGSKQQVVLFKPTVCEKQLCNFSFLDLGLGLDIESEIRFSSTVVDLLISLTYAGAYGRKDHFNPFPVIDEKITEQNQIGEVIKKIPQLKTLSDFIIKKTFIPSLRELDPGANNVYRLIRWIICSNKCHLALVPKELQFPGMDTDLQFILKSTPPAKEKRFRELKKEYGSFYGFHGSPIGNWHSILRNGLTNKAYAQAFGPGIYLARDAATSVGYLYRGGMGSGTSNWPNSEIGTTDLKCMAMCEIIDWSSKESSKHCRGEVHHIGCHHNKSSPYIRVENDDLLVTRFFFVWNKPNNPSVSFVADQNAKLIQKTIEKLTSLK